MRPVRFVDDTIQELRPRMASNDFRFLENVDVTSRRGQSLGHNCATPSGADNKHASIQVDHRHHPNSFVGANCQPRPQRFA